MGNSRPVASSHIPPVFADQEGGVGGAFNDAPDEKLHLEAAAYQGRPVYFAIMGGWEEESLSDEKATVLSQGSVNLVMQTLVTIFLLCAGGYLAFQNYRSGKADRLGATRTALAFFILGLVAWALRSHHVADLILEFRMFARSMGSVMYEVGLVWIFYLALEPYVRRIWPETVISWSRMLAGHWIDPLVGRDVLIGSVVGIFTTLLGTLDRLVPPWVGLPGPMPDFRAVTRMLQSATSASTLFSGAITAIYYGLLLLLFLVLIRIVLRRRVLVSMAFVVIFTCWTARWTSSDFMSWITQGITAVLLLTLLVRHGLVAIIFCVLCRVFLTDFPVTFDLSAWYGPSALCGIGATVFILGIATYAALGGKPVILVRLPQRDWNKTESELK